MKTKILFLAISMVMLPGCVSLNDLVSTGVDTHTGVPTSFSEAKETGGEKAKTMAIVRDSINSIKAKFDYEYLNVFQGTDVDISYKPTANGVDVAFKLSSPRGFFPLGEYDVLYTASHDGRKSIAFTELVLSSITKMRGSLDEVGIKYDLHATFYGNADGAPIKDSGLLYRGEYGEINLSRDEATLNGVPRAFDIRPSQRMTNDELAAVRAYSLKDFVSRGAGHISIINHYDINVSEERGLEYRFAKVTLELREK